MGNITNIPFRGFSLIPKGFPKLITRKMTLLDSVNYTTGSYGYKAFQGCNWYKKTCMSFTPVKHNTFGYVIISVVISVNYTEHGMMFS